MLMTKLPAVVPVTDLRQDAAAVLRRVGSGDRGQPVIITQRGRAAAVLLSLAAYERALRERELLLVLARGEQEIASGEGHDLASVLAEADAILAEDEA
jgi:prevent-host-death family protein